jgi:hypothetical protein
MSDIELRGREFAEVLEHLEKLRPLELAGKFHSEGLNREEFQYS